MNAPHFRAPLSGTLCPRTPTWLTPSPSPLLECPSLKEVSPRHSFKRCDPSPPALLHSSLSTTHLSPQMLRLCPGYPLLRSLLTRKHQARGLCLIRGRVLSTCHRACSQDSLLSALGLQQRTRETWFLLHRDCGQIIENKTRTTPKIINQQDSSNGTTKIIKLLYDRVTEEATLHWAVRGGLSEEVTF